jgi:hypothetical protein
MKEPELSMKRAFPDHQANLVDRREALRGDDFILKAEPNKGHRRLKVR